QRAGDDVALDAAIAEIAALVGALVADGEDLLSAPEERHVYPSDDHELDAPWRKRGEIEDARARHRPLIVLSPPMGEKVWELGPGFLHPSPLWGEGQGEGRSRRPRRGLRRGGGPGWLCPRRPGGPRKGSAARNSARSRTRSEKRCARSRHAGSSARSSP